MATDSGLLTYFGESAPQRYALQETTGFWLKEEMSFNFNAVVSQMSSVPGMSGGFDSFGSDALPRPVGMITQRIGLYANDSDIDTIKDAVRLMQSWGYQNLYYLPTIDGANARYCYARVIDPQLPAPREGHGNTMAEGVLIWTTDEPYWYEDNLESEIINASGASTDDTITHDGTAIALPIITIAPGASDSCENPTIQRLVGATVVDEISYTGTLTDTDELVIDCGAKTVLLNDAQGYTGSNFDFLHVDWLRLMAGDNSIRVTFENGGDAADVTIEWRNTY